MTIKNLDKYLDPPDEPEAEYCESCGEELEWENSSILPLKGGLKCTNPFCPDKHVGIMKEMAELIVDQAETIDKLKTKIRRLEFKHWVDTASKQVEE